MTRPQLADVIDKFNFDGTVSKTQIRKAVPLTESLDRGADVDELIDEAVDAGLLVVKYDPDDYDEDRWLAPEKPMAFEVEQ